MGCRHVQERYGDDGQQRLAKTRTGAHAHERTLASTIPAATKLCEVVMQATDVSHLSISEAAALIQARSVSPTELTEDYLRRIEQLNPRLNAYVEVTADRARSDARQATAEISGGTYRGPLHGVPIGLKDLYDTAGIRTAGGARILMDRVPQKDSTVARKLREAGSVLLGKLNTHELAFGVTTNNPHFGATHNPWNVDAIPGGSSGGSGAAIAAGLAVATTGTDTGGSIRIPGSLCGCVGLKPTYGRVSKAGVLPLSWLLDNTGPITRTVEDAALMLQAMAGYDPDDFATVPVPVDDYVAGLGAGIRGLKLGVPRAYFFDRLDDDVRSAVEQALEVLRGLGAEIREVKLPDFSHAGMPGDRHGRGRIARAVWPRVRHPPAGFRSGTWRASCRRARRTVWVWRPRCG